MENKINIAEILKDCPERMKLYSPLFGKVELVKNGNDNISVFFNNDEGSDIFNTFTLHPRDARISSPRKIAAWPAPSAS